MCHAVASDDAILQNLIMRTVPRIPHLRLSSLVEPSTPPLREFPKSAKQKQTLRSNLTKSRYETDNAVGIMP
jgi:hypothetical protein